jgi:ParB-like chromosome segregation protein Spo0J
LKELKITNKNIDDIKEYENNAKEHPDWQIEQIANSIQEFGFNDPIAINADDQIIEGHGRLLAAKQMGLTEIPCIVLDGLTEVQERAYIIAHNKTTMNTDFDLDRLQYELNALKVEDFDLSLTGFNELEIQKIMDNSDIFVDDYDENNLKKEYKEPNTNLTCPHCGHSGPKKEFETDD